MKSRILLLIIGLALLASAGLMGSPGSVSAATKGGFVIVTGDDADDFGHCSRNPLSYNCGELFPNLFTEAITRSRVSTATVDILAIGVNGSYALTSFNNWKDQAEIILGTPLSVTHAITPADITSVIFSGYKMIYIPSSCNQTGGGIGDGSTGGGCTPTDQISALNTRRTDIASYVNNQGGSLIALTQWLSQGAWGFLPAPLMTSNTAFFEVTVTSGMMSFSPTTTTANLSHCCFHNVFSGPVNFVGLKPLAMSINPANPQYDNKPVYLGGANVILTAEICGDGIDNDNDGLIDGEDPDCQICGDGNLTPDETCDDGNTTGGDGCSSVCQIEGPTNQPPEAVCQNITVEADPETCLAPGSVDNGSSDPDGYPVTLDQTPSGPYGLGGTNVSLLVTDEKGVTDTCSAVVTVMDTTPPAIAGATADPAVLWPPNRKMVGVTVSVDVSDACDAKNGADTSCRIVDVKRIGEIDDDDSGKGHKDDDDSGKGHKDDDNSGKGHRDDDNSGGGWNITGPLTVDLRAGRKGGGDGGGYAITVECTDESGNVSTSEVIVSVPHDQRDKNEEKHDQEDKKKKKKHGKG